MNVFYPDVNLPQPHYLMGLLAIVLPSGYAIVWLLVGMGLFLVELLLGKVPSRSDRYKLVPGIMGMSAIIVAVWVWRGSRSLLLFRWQLAYWIVISAFFAIWVRPIFLKGKRYQPPQAMEAKTLTDISPGETGRVLYEGASWQAYCEDEQVAIAPNEKVYVLRQEGNTLIVVPKHLLH